MATGSGTGTPIGSTIVVATPATKAAILTFVGRAWRTTFAGATLDEAIKACLGDLNELDLLRDCETSFALTADDTSLAWPDNYKSIISIQLTDVAGVVYDPLDEFPGDVRAFRHLAPVNSGAGRPTGFVEDPATGTFLIAPTSDGTYSVTIDYWKTHPQTPDAIVYPITFQHLLNLGTAYWEAMLRGNEKYINIWGPMYFKERQVMENRQMPVVGSVVR